jgi:amidase
MIGCIGTAPERAVASELAGPFGGNLDHPTLGAGARLVLPVFRPGGLLYVGDVHAAQGDGELSGWGLETAAEIDLALAVEPGAAPAWPWLRTPGRLAVLTAGPTFEDARAAAVGAILDAMEAQLGLAPAEALALVSVAGDLRLGQAYGAEIATVRLEVPASLGLRPHPRPAERPPCPT